MANFPNGFKSWQETHYEIVSMLTLAYEKDNIICDFVENKGTGGLYELSKRMTDAFELENRNRVWDGEYFDEIEFFFSKEIKQLSL